MSNTARRDAFLILQRVLSNKASLSSLQNSSPLSKAICFGVCRHYLRLQVILDQLVEKRPKDADLCLLIIMGLYQLLYLDKPAYATVTETVALLGFLKKNWAKGLVNAVLRRFCRERESVIAKLQDNETFVYGHPAWFRAMLRRDWPDQWSNILIANDEHPPMSLRVNLNAGSRDAYQTRLPGLSQVHEFSPAGLMLNQPCDVQDLPGFNEGDVSVQDEAAQLAVSLLDLAPGQRVLDVCAAPGGKTCHILETMPDIQECFALDIDEDRLQRIADNAARLGLKPKIQLGDASLPAVWWDGQPFDRILLDAPCSATGVIRRHPDIKLLRKKEDIDAVVKLQAKILAAVWPLLRVGGVLVYATCSVLKVENELQIENFLGKHPDGEFQDRELPWGQARGVGWQIFPGQNNCDGFFYSVLKKTKA